MEIDNSLVDKFNINNPEDEKTKKINKMLDKYFKFPNVDHLSINYVEFKNYLSSLDCIDEEEEKSTYNFNPRYNNFYEQINKAKIYPGKYNPKIVKYNTVLILFSIDFLLLCGTCIPILLGAANIINLIIYIVGIFIICIFIYKIGLFSIKKFDRESLIKLIKILNAKPSIELYYKKECIFTIHFHSYADVTGIQAIKKGSSLEFNNEFEINMDAINLNKTLFLEFPLKNLFFVDSTKQYFKFLILQFNKYCYLHNNGYDRIYTQMYLKFCLHTADNEIIYRNDPFFFTSFTTMNLFCFYTTLMISIFTLLSPLFYLVWKCLCKRKVIEIKKTVSIKNDLENIFDLDALFLKIVTSTDVNVSRQKHEVISEKVSIFQEFIQICVEITEKTREVKNCQLEIEGKLVPFNVQSGLNQNSSWLIKDFEYAYGTKVEKILGVKVKSIFINFNASYSNELYYQEGGGDSDDEESNENHKHRRINTHSNNIENEKSLRSVTYTEKILSITCHIGKPTVSCSYNIKLPDGHNKTGKFDIKKPLSHGFENLEEKVNQDWTKSEIYIPGCKDRIIIIRKRRAIRILLENQEIVTSETRLNDEIHAGAGSWLDGNNWDKRTMDQFVKQCNRTANKNRFKTTS